MKPTLLARSFSLVLSLAALTTFSAPSSISVTHPSASKGSYSDRIVATWPGNSYAYYGYNVYRTPTSSYYNPIKLGKTSNCFWVDRTPQRARKYWYWIGPIYEKYPTYSYSYYYVGRTLYRRTTTTWHYTWYAPYSGTTAGNAQGGYRAVTIPTPTVSRGKSRTALYVSWNSSPQALYGYRVYRSASPSFSSAVSVGVTYDTHFLDYTVPNRGQTYYYWVAPRCFNITPYNANKYGAGWLAY